MYTKIPAPIVGFYLIGNTTLTFIHTEDFPVGYNSQASFLFPVQSSLSLLSACLLFKAVFMTCAQFHASPSDLVINPTIVISGLAMFSSTGRLMSCSFPSINLIIITFPKQASRRRNYRLYKIRTAPLSERYCIENYHSKIIAGVLKNEKH